MSIGFPAMQELIYTGNSMLGVFAPGDCLLADPVEFDRVCAGDIVVFDEPGAPGKQIVHRVIGKTADRLLTQGDNNPEPDSYAVASSAALLLVVSARRGAAEVKFANAAAGLADFRRHRLRLRLRLLAVRLFGWPLRLAPLRLLASPVEKLELRRFRRSGQLVKALLFRGDTAVAAYDFKKERWAALGRWKLFYSPGMLSGFQPEEPASGSDRK